MVTGLHHKINDVVPVAVGALKEAAVDVGKLTLAFVTGATAPLVADVLMLTVVVECMRRHCNNGQVPLCIFLISTNAFNRFFAIHDRHLNVH